MIKSMHCTNAFSSFCVKLYLVKTGKTISYLWSLLFLWLKSSVTSNYSKSELLRVTYSSFFMTSLFLSSLISHSYLNYTLWSRDARKLEVPGTCFAFLLFCICRCCYFSNKCLFSFLTLPSNAEDFSSFRTTANSFLSHNHTDFFLCHIDHTEMWHDCIVICDLLL